MFEGGNDCVLCKKAVDEKNRIFRKSLVGNTYTFCRNCFETRKEEVQKIIMAD